MLDFTLVRNKEITVSQLVAGLTREDLQALTNEMVDTILALIAGCRDEDVAYVPADPEAYDPVAATEAELHLPWTLGHVIVHTTASAEEAAAIAAELARGVPHRGGRSRSEIPWQTVITMAQCHHRLEESRRLRLASLEMWPDPPHLDNTIPGRDGEAINAVARFVNGLRHDDSHLEQIANVVAQARAARQP
ncbi:MAG: DinB family protein [Chloroflexi bacterium]|nr:DinB family protein [Chloroflexota bacterium]MCI0577893.1 DinB family protein [Chloroflexota bacterium]MCI0644471.1 DinB family protein [Chloroflexota bacterium]MCI0730261.1 DinB family protein [Chloroflexota bacterium]